MQRAQVSEGTATAGADQRPSSTQQVEPMPEGLSTAQPGPANGETGSMAPVERVEGTGGGAPPAAAMPGTVEKLDEHIMPLQGLFGGGTTTVELSSDC